MSQVYILHGWTYSTAKWQPLLGQLVAAGIKAELLHVPGLTASSDEVWDVDKYIAWLSQQTKSQKQPFVLIGHSNGGRLALNFALAHPDRVKQLVLIDSAGIYHNELGLRLKRAVFKAAAKTGKKLTSSTKLRGLLYRAAGSHDYEQAAPNMRQTMLKLTESDSALDLERINTPTTLIWGSADSQTPLKDAQTMKKRLPDAKLRVIEGARHAPYDTHPDETAKLIIEALK